MRLKKRGLLIISISSRITFTHYAATSNKNRAELKECADGLDIQLCKIGWVLTTDGWHLVSEQSTLCRKTIQPFRHFTQDSPRTSRSQESYSSLAQRLSSHAFVNWWSLNLQKRECIIIMAHKAICQQIRVFKVMPEQPSRHTLLSQRRVQENSFQGVH